MLDALEDDNTLLLWSALHRQDLEAVQNIISDGVDVNIPDRHGTTPLLIASYTDQTDLVQELLNADACVNAVNNTGQTALHMAAKNGNTEIVNLLLKYECRINSMSKFSGMTALHEASQRGHHEIVQILLEHGANINALDMISKKAEYYAASEEVREIFQKYKDMNGDTKSDMNSNLHSSIVYPEDPPELKEILEKYKDEIQVSGIEKPNLKEDGEKVVRKKDKNYSEKLGNSAQKKHEDKTNKLENISTSLSSKKEMNKLDYLDKANEIRQKYKAISEKHLHSEDKKCKETTKQTQDKLKDIGRNERVSPVEDSVKVKEILQKHNAACVQMSNLEDKYQKEFEEKTVKDKTIVDLVKAKGILHKQSAVGENNSNLEKDKSQKEIVWDSVKAKEILQKQRAVGENNSNLEKDKSQKEIVGDSVKSKEILQKQRAVGENNSNLEEDKSQKEIVGDSVKAKEILQIHRATSVQISMLEDKNDKEIVDKTVQLKDTGRNVRRETLEDSVKAKEILQKRRATSVQISNLGDKKGKEINEKMVKLKDTVRNVRRKTLEDSVKAREILQKHKATSEKNSNFKGEDKKEIAEKALKPIDFGRKDKDKYETTENTNAKSVRTVKNVTQAEDSHSLSSGSESGSQTSLSKITPSKKTQKEKVILKDHTVDFSDKHRQRMKVNVFDRLTKK